MNLGGNQKIRKGERIYEHKNENANTQPFVVLRDAGRLDAGNGGCRRDHTI